MPISVERGGTARVPFAAPEGAEFRRAVRWTIFPEGVAEVRSRGGENMEEVDVNGGPRDGVALMSGAALMRMPGGIEGTVYRYAQVVVGTPGDTMAELQAASEESPADQPAQGPEPTPTAPQPAPAPAQDVGAAGVPSTATVEGHA
jgi:hypothetical protein